jgi:hypothetical protein
VKVKRAATVTDNPDDGRNRHLHDGTVLELSRFRAAVRAWAAGGPDASAAAAVARALARDGLAAVVLVEGVSDQSALEALAGRRHRDLAGEGICVLPIGGAMGASRFLRVLGGPGLTVEVRGLCDEAEERYFRRGLEQAGLGTGLTRRALESRGFYVCVADLEDELIRALGVSGVERVLAVENELAKFRLFQNQPAQRGRPIERQLHRFIGTIGGRKARYARALVDALEPDRVPRPLDGVLAAV